MQENEFRGELAFYEVQGFVQTLSVLPRASGGKPNPALAATTREEVA